MVGPSSTTTTTTTTIKFLCSYGGKIHPRYPDGKLRYHGGDTRVLAVDRSISFNELLVKLGELCGAPVSLRCQLPTEDLDALISITSDEDLANLIDEYNRFSSLKIRAFLSLPKSSNKKIISQQPSSSSSSTASSNSSIDTTTSSSSSSSPTSAAASTSRFATADRCFRQISSPIAFPLRYERSSGKIPQCAFRGHGNPSHIYLIHNGNHWQ